MLCPVVEKVEAQRIMEMCHNGYYGGHFVEDFTTHKVLIVGYFWATLFKDYATYCRLCAICQSYGRRFLPHGLVSHFSN